VQAVIRPTAALKIVPAYRVDHIDGHFLNVASATRAPINDYGLVKQPKLSVSYDLAQDVVAYANWGRTFQIGSGNGAYRTQARDLAPSTGPSAATRSATWAPRSAAGGMRNWHGRPARTGVSAPRTPVRKR